MSDEHKYARGISARPASHKTPFEPLEIVTLVHVASLTVVGSWAFGGNAEWSRTLLSWLASLGGLITLTALQSPLTRREGARRPLRWLWPLAAFNALVLASSFNHSFREVTDGLHTMYVQTEPNPNFPSSARPLLALRQLWFFDGVYLSCFNLAFVIRQRRALRALLLVLSANAVILAVFGTVQMLVGSTGLYFGLQKSPQRFFFSTFVYHNHWGAFILLMTALSVGLVFHFARRRESRDFWHSPALSGLVAILLLASSVPMSGSRSTTLAVLGLLGLATLHWIARLIRQRRAYRESVALPLVLTFAGVGGAAWFAYDFARPMIELRLNHTAQQVAQMREMGGVGSRAVLYRDVRRMAAEKPWFGWGMASFPTVFYLYNTQQISKRDGLPNFYNDAHSDWLQAFAEHGCVGTTLLALCGLVPLWYRRHALFQSPLTLYLLCGCGLLLLYAWVEFPFGNGSVIIAFWTCFFCAVHYGRLDGATDNPA